MPFVIPELLRNPNSVLCPSVGSGDCCGLLILNDLSVEVVENCLFPPLDMLPSALRIHTVSQAPPSNLPQFIDPETAADAEGLSCTILLFVLEAHQETQLEKKATFACV